MGKELGVKQGPPQPQEDQSPDRSPGHLIPASHYCPYQPDHGSLCASDCINIKLAVFLLQTSTAHHHAQVSSGFSKGKRTIENQDTGLRLSILLGQQS